jgi:IS5 family transposase
MLRIYFLQQWFNLSDPAVEEALYDSQAMRRFVGIDLGRHLGQKRCSPRRLGVAFKTHCRQRQLLHPPPYRTDPPHPVLYYVCGAFFRAS